MSSRDELAGELYENFRKMGYGPTRVVPTTKPPGVEFVISEDVRLRFYVRDDCDPLVDAARILRAVYEVAAVLAPETVLPCE